MTGQWLRYAAVGLANTGIGFAVILLLDLGLGVGHVMANAAGYAIGAACSYALNRTYTFRSQSRHRRAVPAFMLLMAACWGINVLVLMFARSVLHWPALPAQALAVLTYAVLFFLGSRAFVFRDPQIASSGKV